MRACVVGAGSIGSLLAAHLATVADVLVLTRREEHARALNAEGLRVSGRHDFTARVTAASDPRELLRRVTSSDLDPEPYLEYLRTKFA